MAGREMWRRPGSFIVPTGILVLLAVLLLYPSAVLDGMLDGSTAAVRNARADLVVYSSEANGVMARSTLSLVVREKVESTPGVDEVAGFSASVLTATVERGSAPVSLAVLVAEDPLGPSSPGPGEAVVDRHLRQQADVEVGDRLVVGPFRVPVTVTGFTEGISLWLMPGLVVDRGTWLEMLGQEPGEVASDPDALPAAQTLMVTVDAGADPAEVAADVDGATADETVTMTVSEAIQAMPGVAEQEETFGYLKAVTLAAAVVVVGLFLSFMTLERTPLYAVLKALGASSRQLLAGVILQALVITAAAVAAAAGVTWALIQIPLELPAAMSADRLIETLVALAVTAVAGGALSLRRVVRIDPADAVG